MIDVEKVTDQKSAPGLIENPCRDALIDLASQVPAGECVVEIGSYMGRSTGHLALGVERGGRGVKVHAIDPWEQRTDYDPDYLATARSVADYSKSETRQAFEAHLASSGAAEYVEVHQGLAVDVASEWEGPKVGLLFHDGDHATKAVFEDLKAWLPHMASGSVVVLHDTDDVRYGVSEGARKAFTRTKQLREQWDWAGREVHPWAKNQGRAPDERRRGFTVVRCR
mgnify:CR=1 FL=1